jgi:16S rRNA (adenine1518-N6/adenine1519-N6)-dimethyltransferase
MSSSLYADEIKRVKDLLELMGRGSKRSLGQNFLVNSMKIDQITNEDIRRKPATVVEVGPGLGALTLRLKETAPEFLLIEMDKQFATYWIDQGYKVLEDDALKVDWRGLDLKKALLVSNLPYQIGARLVVDRCVEPAGVETMVLMFQKEVGKRLTAQPRTEDYSLLTVMVQTFWKVSTFTDLGPNDYFPPPNVASRVVIFESKPSPVVDRAAYLKFVKLSFSQKRKFLKKSLLNMVDETRLEAAFHDLDISLKARPEELSVDTFVKLFHLLSGATEK